MYADEGLKPLSHPKGPKSYTQWPPLGCDIFDMVFKGTLASVRQFAHPWLKSKSRYGGKTTKKGQKTPISSDFTTFRPGNYCPLG